ncbi:DNA mismatch repair protein [Bipolaris maydis]|nr:DNA mismatch repair protein [Bipolaris maydis]
MPDASGQTILPLPDHAVAQIKSSAAIVSLAGVVLELVKNSLDAKATRVEATVDFVRGGCIVEDDGLGISPLEFSDKGRLGKLYCTSKYHAKEPLLGRNGTFLASLAAMSLLTIASHHHEYRSQNAVTFHHASVVERQLPASAHHEVHGRHGTRVTVRNLFGNMPVRVKQRALIAAQKEEYEKMCEGLKHDIAGLLLGWQGTVSVRVRDGDNKPILNLNTTARTDQIIGKVRSAQLTSLLNILTQANYIGIDEWSSWVPASASTSTVSVKGAISLDPAPSKHVQFLSLGIRPLSSDSRHNELFDHVNRLFAHSSFGTVEEAVVDAYEKMRQQSDKRFKKDGYTNRQLKMRKDVDRYPMFHLRISLAEANGIAISEDQVIGDEANLQSIMDVLEAMITQWLVVHHFRPRQSRKRRDPPDTASSLSSVTAASDSSALSRSVSTGELLVPENKSACIGTRKRKRSKDSNSHENLKKHHQAFATWSRIKSGKSEFFNSLPTRPKLGSQSGNERNSRSAVQSSGGNEPFASFAMQPIAQGAFGAPTAQNVLPNMGETFNAEEKENDDSILWTDPSTGKTHLLNSKTGCVMSNVQARPNTDRSPNTFRFDQRPISKSVRLPSRASTATAKPTPWLDNMLQNWENPIFKPSEQRIQQITNDQDKLSHHHNQVMHSCSHLMDISFETNTTSITSKFSKSGLQTAQVISQVDRKFILVKMQPASQSNDILVLIDQHAADERIQVESLFQQLCTPSSLHTYSSSQLGHKSDISSLALEKPLSFAVSPHEQALFITHAARFAAWGILYDIPASALSSSNQASLDARKKKRKCEALLLVTALPPVIAQRCVTDPKVLISMLRSAVWGYAEGHLPPPPSSTPSSFPEKEEEEDTTKEDKSWVRALSSCPAALVNLINSRACRSAIMFNDELSLAECRELVEKLAECVFPFMCAHGRPSMVPLVGLGERAACALGDHSGSGKSFVQAWKDWKR